LCFVFWVGGCLTMLPSWPQNSGLKCQSSCLNLLSQLTLKQYFNNIKTIFCWVWWCTSVILALKKLKQEDHKVEASHQGQAEPHSKMLSQKIQYFGVPHKTYPKNKKKYKKLRGWVGSSVVQHSMRSWVQSPVPKKILNYF
jgi:hypothetical protein